MLPEDSEELGRWPGLKENASEWMADARRMGVTGYRQVLEDGPDVCGSESDSDHSDHGEM
jgi:hypothetical protein